MKKRKEMKKSKKLILLGTLLACMLIFISCAPEESENNTSAEISPSVSQEPLLGEFESMDLEGNKWDESIFVQHKLTMINVWATFCGPCINEMPDLAQIHEEYEQKGVQVIGIVGDVVNMDGSLSEENVQLAHQIIEETGADYTHLLPTSDLMPILSQVTAYPQTFFVDQNGNQVGKDYIGSRDKGEWEAVIQEMLAKLPQDKEEAGTAQMSVPSGGTKQDVDICRPMNQVGEQTPLETFIAQDVNGQRVSEQILREDEIVLVLFWNPQWEQSGETIEKIQQYLDRTEKYEDNGALGILVSYEEEQKEKGMQIIQQGNTSFPHIIPQGELENWIDQEDFSAPEIWLITPWGEKVGSLSISDDIEQWSSQVNDTVYQLYLGCAS